MKIQAIVTAADSLGGCTYATTDRQKRPLHWLKSVQAPQSWGHSISPGGNQLSLSIQQITTEPYVGTMSATLRY